MPVNRIDVRAAYASDEGSYLQLAFGEALDQSARYALLQLAKVFDLQDQRLGMAGLYLEIGDQAHGA